MTDPVAAIAAGFNFLDSEARKSGYFDTGARHEFKNAPPARLTFELWQGPIEPIPERSGMAATTYRAIIRLRINISMLAEPQDDIDRDMGMAAMAMIVAIHANFDIDMDGVEIDLLGAHGVALGALPGYIPRDGKMYRCADVQVPLIINDAVPQAR